MTPAQTRALFILSDGPMPCEDLPTNRIQERVLQALAADGFARFFPTGKPPSWKITPAGRNALLGRTRDAEMAPSR